MAAAGIDAARLHTDKLSGSIKEQRPGRTALFDYARSGVVIVVVGLDRLGAISARGSRNRRNVHGYTWQWADGEWTKLQEIGPPPRVQHAMAFDTNQNRLVLFGGQTGQRKFADTWEAPMTGAGPPP